MSTINKKYPVTGDEIRKAFIEFYEKKDHKIISSASLIPEDPTVLLTIAGMLPFKSVFMGIKTKPSNRATSSQKCIRTNDIENVGVTARHHTFFEMLGNFSFGDYFKQDAIQWAWELVTKIYNLDKKNIVISVFNKDEESKKIWEEKIGIDPDKIISLDEKDNFWSSGLTGPCGPCSELYYDFHPERGMANINLDDDSRFIEFYNLVFMQFTRNSKGELLDLETKNIDTGMGLERMAQILQKKKNNYETDLIFPIINEASRLANIDYSEADLNQKVSLKILGDHTRAVIHLISDGVIASNLGRGYILRRLIRRMIRHGKLLGIKHEFISKLALIAIKIMRDTFPELQNNLDRIVNEINIEEQRFLETLERGEKLLNQIISKGVTMISGSQAFELYDTYGFPLELTKEILDEKNISVDTIGFENQMNAQRKRAKDASQNIDLTLEGSIERDIEFFEKTEFVGYEELFVNACIKGIFHDSNSVEKAHQGQNVQIILDRTSFYAESGGQVGDNGLIVSGETQVLIKKVVKKKDVILHYGVINQGLIKVNQVVEARVDKLKRFKAESNHTATHLLQSALKLIVDESVSQRGSLVGFNKFRFDFNAPQSVSKDQINRIENTVNKWILENHSIEVKTMKKNDALKAGALAMFGEKYGEIVRVVDVPGVSMELCGGTHVKKTSELGCFKIISEIGISSGIRRIEALSGQSILTFLSENILVVNKLNDLLKTNSYQLFDRVTSLQNELICKNKEIKKINSEIAFLKYSSLLSSMEEIFSCPVIIQKLNGLDSNMLQSAGNDLVSKLGSNSAVIIGGIPNDASKKALFIVCFGADLVVRGFHAGKLVNDIAKICSGGGGGKPNIAQAGAKNVDKIEEALNYAKQYLLEKLNN